MISAEENLGGFFYCFFFFFFFFFFVKWQKIHQTYIIVTVQGLLAQRFQLGSGTHGDAKKTVLIGEGRDVGETCLGRKEGKYNENVIIPFSVPCTNTTQFSKKKKKKKKKKKEKKENGKIYAVKNAKKKGENMLRFCNCE